MTGYRVAFRHEAIQHRPGLRTVGYKKRVVIAFAVLDDTVAILGMFYGGPDYETLLAQGDYE